MKQIHSSGSRSGPNQLEKGVSLTEIFFKAKQMERKGIDVIHFDAGEPDFKPPSKVVEAAVKALRAGKSRYTEPGGLPDVRKAVAEHVNQKYHANFSKEQVLLTVGGRLALYYAFQTLAKKSKVGIISPDWSAYRDISTLLGFKTHFFKTSLEDLWTPDIREIEKENCNVLVLNYPNNPTGKILDPRTFDRIVEIAKTKKITLISDEVYSDYVLSQGRKFKSVLETRNCRFIFTTSLSKSYSMTGYRAGYLIADNNTIARLEKINAIIMTSVPEFVQHAMAAALDCPEYVKEKVELIRKRKDVAVRALRSNLTTEFYEPDGSLYIFPRIRSSKQEFDSESFALSLLEKAHVSLTPGTPFGSRYANYVRFTLLQSEERIREGIERIGKLLS